MRDAFIEFLGNNEQNIAGDNFAQKSGYLDASFSYKLPMETDFSISLELQNLTNEQLLTYFRDDAAHAARVVRARPPGPAGISGSF